MSIRGAIVEWSETLGYGAESHRKFVRSRETRFCHPSDDWKTLSVNSAENGYFSNQERVNQRKDERKGMGSASHQLCPRYSGPLTPTAPTAIRLRETFNF